MSRQRRQFVGIARRPTDLTHRPTRRFWPLNEDITMRVYYDRDADLNLIKGKKVVIVG
jgi:hypothetical protein